MAINSDPSNWVGATIDAQPSAYSANSDPSGWVVTTVFPADGFGIGSDPTAWLSVTLSAGPPATGMFLVNGSDVLIPINAPFP